MIFYFSGTGNSLYVAKSIKSNDEELISISKEIHSNKDTYEYDLKEEESITFVFPVYAWAPPEMVIDFIKKIKLKNHKDNYICSVITCGEEIGNAMDYFNNKLKDVGLELSSGFSIVAPNNYIIMGDVDNKEIEYKKLKELENKIRVIKNTIDSKKRGVFEVDKGRAPKFTTNVISQLFNNYARNTKKFSANDNCTGCKICEKVCNNKCIRVNNKPVWSGECSQCLGCINYCPTKAIQYGKSTAKKGRYTNPNVKVNEMYL